jgi:hypothetical protein
MKLDFFTPSYKTTEEQEELFQVLTENALSGDHTKKEFIQNTSEWWLMQDARSGLLKVIALYDSIVGSLYKEYCKQVLQGTADFEMLVALRQFKACVDFYQEEFNQLEDMAKEYRAYLNSGHLIDQWLLFKTRDVGELWDHRGETKNDN